MLKVNGRVLIITNIDISDRLINEQTETFKHIETKENIVWIIYLAFDDSFTGRTRINGNDVIAKITGRFLLRECRCQYTLANIKQHQLQFKEPNFH